MTAPALITISVFGILPLIIIVIYSFLKAAPYGGVVWSPSVEACAKGSGHDPTTAGTRIASVQSR